MSKLKADIIRATEIYEKAVKALGRDLGGGNVVDLLADNMEGDIGYLRAIASCAGILGDVRRGGAASSCHTYRGFFGRDRMDPQVLVDNKFLDPQFKHVNHSPDGFAWGYGGSGPSQLAFAILAHHFGRPKPEAMCLYQDFKWKVISRLEQDAEWTLTTQDIAVALAEIHEDRQKLNEQYRNLSF